METMKEIWRFLRVRKKFWLAPIILALMFLSLLIIFAGQSAIVGPLMYVF